MLISKFSKNKNSFLIIATIIVVFISVGIFTNNTNENSDKANEATKIGNEEDINLNSDRFSKLSDCYLIDKKIYDVVVDSKTNIIYLVNKDNASMIPLYTSDGKVMSYTDYCNLKMKK